MPPRDGWSFEWCRTPRRQWRAPPARQVTRCRRHRHLRLVTIRSVETQTEYHRNRTSVRSIGAGAHDGDRGRQRGGSDVLGTSPLVVRFAASRSRLTLHRTAATSGRHRGLKSTTRASNTAVLITGAAASSGEVVVSPDRLPVAPAISLTGTSRGRFPPYRILGSDLAAIRRYSRELQYPLHRYRYAQRVNGEGSSDPLEPESHWRMTAVIGSRVICLQNPLAAAVVTLWTTVVSGRP